MSAFHMIYWSGVALQVLGVYSEPEMHRLLLTGLKIIITNNHPSFLLSEFLVRNIRFFIFKVRQGSLGLVMLAATDLP